MTHDIHCRKCGRFLGSFEETNITVTLKCANCKSLERYHYVNLSGYVPNHAILRRSTKAQSKSVRTRTLNKSKEN